MPVRVNGDASMDVSWAVGITTNVSDALHLSYFHLLLVSLRSKGLLASVESLTALAKSWDSRDAMVLCCAS